MAIEWTSRIRSRAKNRGDLGEYILDVLEKPEVQDRMRAFILQRKKPHPAFTEQAIKDGRISEFTTEDTKVAGEAITHVATHILGAVRTSGSRIIKQDLLFRAGESFAFGDAAMPVARSGTQESNALHAAIVTLFRALSKSEQEVLLAELQERTYKGRR